MSAAVRNVLSAGLSACGIALALPSATGAYWNFASCTGYVSAQTCWVGGGYHGIIRVDAELWGFGKPEVCAKAMTAAGNIRTGSGCSYNTNGRDSTLSSTEPASGGYGYWGGSGSSGYWGVEECSPSDIANCIYIEGGIHG